MPVIGIDFPIAVLFVFEAPPRSDLEKKNKPSQIKFYFMPRWLAANQGL